MKTFLRDTICVCLLLLTGAVIVACSSDDAVEQSQPLVYTVAIQATLPTDDATRALSGGGNDAIAASWGDGEAVYVKKGGTSLGTLTPQTTGTAAATLKGTLSGATISAGDELTLTYLKSAIDYSGQKGTLADIGSNFAYATATVSVSTVSGTTITTGDASFENQQAIVRFTLKGEASETLNPTALSVKYGETTLSLTDIPAATYTTNGAGTLYVALPAFSSQLLTLTATVGSDTYKYEKPAVSFDNGKYYPVSVRMGKKDDSYNATNSYLTLQALNSGTTITFDNKATGIVEYRVNSGAWTTLAAAGGSGTTTSLNAGDKVSLRGSNATYTIEGDTKDTPSSISCSGPCYVYGNFMSLIGGDSFATVTTLSAYSPLGYLFDGNTSIRNHPYKDMVLPATTLSDHCYYRMFAESSVGRSPIMAAASSLPNRGYAEMYSRCLSLYYITCLSAIDNGASTYDIWVNYVPAFTFGTFVTKAENISDWSDRRTESGVPLNWTIKSSE